MLVSCILICYYRTNRLYAVLKKLCSGDNNLLTDIFASDRNQPCTRTAKLNILPATFQCANNICLLFCLLFNYQLQLLDDEDIFVTLDYLIKGNVSNTIIMWRNDTFEVIELIKESLYRWCWDNGDTMLTFMQIFFVGSECKLKSHCVADLQGHCGEKLWYYIKSMLQYAPCGQISDMMDIDDDSPSVSSSSTNVTNKAELPSLEILMKAHLFLKIYGQLYERYVRYINHGHSLEDINLFTWNNVMATNKLLCFPKTLSNLQIMNPFDNQLLEYLWEVPNSVYGAAYFPVNGAFAKQISYAVAAITKGVIAAVPQVYCCLTFIYYFFMFFT